MLLSHSMKVLLDILIFSYDNVLASEKKHFNNNNLQQEHGIIVFTIKITL